jgi:glycosyltransferase involved in cell wall biosynthesis
MSMHIDRPLVTVLLPVYNARPYLAETLASIFTQTYTHFELLAIDDGSTDGSADLLRAVTDPRLRVMEHGSNQGLIATLNEGLALARGNYIARMDSDDVMHPERLQRQVENLELHPDIGVLATFVDLVNADGETTGMWDIDRATADEASISAMLPRTNCIAHPSVMIRRSALGEMRYDPRQQGAEDWDLWLRMLARGALFAKLPEALLKYRIHPTSIMGGQKQQVPYERRLLSTRRRFMIDELRHGKFGAVLGAVLHAQLRTWARYLRSSVLPALMHDVYRCLTYSPFALVREQRALLKVEQEWKGRTIFLLPYVHTGGAEQVHADIVAAVEDQQPLIVISGFSTDRALASTFKSHGTLLELPRSLHHPFYRRRTRQRLAALANTQQDPVVFGALSTTFFELLEHLRPEVRTYYLQHAFLYQPEGNAQHKSWLRHFSRVDGYIFVSGHAKAEYERFLFANNIPRSQFGKLMFISNAVQRFGSVQEHERTGLLFVGRPSPEKRLDLFLDLCTRLENAAPGHFRFTDVGADKVPGNAHVQFLGRINDPQALSDIYQQHDLLALTSTREGFPLVIMEAMAHGLVVLSTPVGDVPERLNADCTVVTSSIEESVVLQEMTRTIIELDNDRVRLLRMKACALQKARADFAPEAFREHYRALLLGEAD